MNQSERPQKLSDMVDALENTGITLNILRTASTKDPDFPAPKGGAPNIGYTYLLSEVATWARRRSAASAARKEARK